jgi:hypothetical protein
MELEKTLFTQVETVVLVLRRGLNWSLDSSRRELPSGETAKKETT